MQFSPNNPQFCKFSIKKSEILTFHMQKRGNLQGLVKGLFLTGKKIFPVGHSPRPNKSRAFLPHRSNRGAGLTLLSQQSSSGNLGVCLKREPASHQHLEN